MVKQRQEQRSSGFTDQFHVVLAASILPAVPSWHQVCSQAKFDNNNTYDLIIVTDWSYRFQKLDIEASTILTNKAMYIGAAAGLSLFRINKSDGSCASSRIWELQRHRELTRDPYDTWNEINVAVQWTIRER